MQYLTRYLAPLLLAALLLIPAGPAHAQSLPPYVFRGLDSALSAIYMTRADLSMRWDLVPDDPYRVSTIKRLFGDPLGAFDLADTLGTIGFNGFDEPGMLFTEFSRLLDMTGNLVAQPRPIVNDAELRVMSKINLDSTDYNSALILRKFLSLALATDAKILSNRGAISQEQLQRLVDFSDSLVLESQEDANASLIELKQAERYGLARAKRFFNEDARSLDYQSLMSPGTSLFLYALESARAMASEAERLGTKIKTRIWNTPQGKVAIGGPGDDVYTGDFFCIIDVGGNDIYKPTPSTKARAFDHSTTLIVDFSGNDTYIGGDYAFGGALFGASTVIDLKGDDNYIGGNFSLGCGYFGVGVLYDGEGSDRYTGGTCTQGAGLFGIGLLIDGQGNDVYTAHLESQGFGYTRGIGAIIEHGGNDTYIAASPYTDYLRYSDHFETFCQGAALGYRPIASGGFGIIADSSGNDTYSSDIFGQGTAYWYGFGTIIDGKGNDNYSAFQYSQGAGIHLAFGVLIDRSGNDNYVSHGVSQGCGHDIGFGGLYDKNGDDNYVVESLSLGGGNADAISVFIDGGGNDGYIARVNNTLGYSDLRREYGMIGIFLDLQGNDFYGTPRGANNSLWTGSYYGAGLDAEFRPKEEADPVNPGEVIKSKEQIDAELGKDIQTLFIQASAAPQKYQYIVQPAQRRLVERADESLPYLLSQLNSESPRERLALGLVLPRIGSKAMGPLIDTVLHGSRSRVSMALFALGEMHDSTAAEAIGRKLVDSADMRLRIAAGEAILKIRNPAPARDYLRRALKDTVELVRAYAARALARIANDSDLALLYPLLHDTSQIVRYQVQSGLRGMNPDSLSDRYTTALLADRNGYSYDLLYSLASSITDSETRARILNGLLEDPNPRMRAGGVRLALEWNDEESIRRAAELKGTENTSLVLYELDKIPDVRHTTKKELRDWIAKRDKELGRTPSEEKEKKVVKKRKKKKH
jgi:HEAT repeat protein